MRRHPAGALLLADLREGYEGKRVWLFTHQAVIMSFRYVLENFTEQELLEIDTTTDLPNCSVTSYRAAGDGVELVRFADTSAVEKRAGAHHGGALALEEANHDG